MSKYAISPRVQTHTASCAGPPFEAPPFQRWGRIMPELLADHPADLDAYQLALRTLVDAVDRHTTGPLRSELADALGQARELLDQDREAS